MSKKIKVAYSGFFHETNTYATSATGKTSLDSMVVYRGAQIFALRGSALGGPVDECFDNDWELLPGALFIMKDTFGLVDQQCYRMARQEILDTLQGQLPVDVVYLLVHGAGVVEDMPDLEGDLVASVRALVGENTVIVSSADLHGKVTEQVARNYDFFSACKEYPHSDLSDCARNALSIGVSIAQGLLRPTMAWHKVPLLLGLSTTELEGTVASRLKEKCKEVERLSGVLNCSVMHGFPYQDTNFCGMYPMVTTNDDAELAQRLAKELAEWIWAEREASLIKPLSVDEAIRQAREVLDRNERYQMRPMNEARNHKPVIIADGADNPGAGAPGDSTHLLRAVLQEKGLGRVAFFSIHDPETVSAAVSAGVGATIAVRLGGKYDNPRGGDPIEAMAYVKSISDGKEVVRGPMAYGVEFDLGPTVRLVIEGVDVTVLSGLCQAFDDTQGRPHGIIIDEYDIICVKSSAHWRAFYHLVSNDSFVADSPGLSSMDYRNFEHTKLESSIYPLDWQKEFSVSF